MTRVGVVTGIAAAAVAVGSFILSPHPVWPPSALAQGAQWPGSPARCDPNVGIAVDHVTVVHEESHLFLRVPIQVKCERLQAGPDQYLVYLNPPDGDPAPLDYAVETREGGLDVLFLLDIDPAYLVSTPSGDSSAMEFLEPLYGRLVHAFQFRGKRPSDVASVAVPGVGLFTEKRIMDGNLIYNQLVESTCQLSLEKGEAGEFGIEEFREWMRDCGRESEGPLVVIVSWRPGGVGHLAPALEQAREKEVPVHIVSIGTLQEDDQRLVEGLGANLHSLHGQSSVLSDVGASEDVLQFRAELGAEMAQIRNQVGQARLCSLSFTTGVLVDESQVERLGDRDLTTALYVSVSRKRPDNSTYDCWLPLAFTSQPPDGRGDLVPWIGVLIFFTFLPLGLILVYVLGLLYPRVDVFLDGWLNKIKGR